MFTGGILTKCYPTAHYYRFDNKKCRKNRLKLPVDVTFLTCQRKGNKNQRNDAVIAKIIGTLLLRFECGCYCGHEKQLESKRKGRFAVTKSPQRECG